MCDPAADGSPVPPALVLSPGLQHLSNSTKPSPFLCKGMIFEHLLHCVSFKRVPKPWVPVYIVYFLNILRAVCSWYLLPSCMVKLLILFPKEKLSRSMCKHSTWQPFKCAHRYCVCKAERFSKRQFIKMESKVTCFSLHGIQHVPRAALIVILMPVYLN